MCKIQVSQEDSDKILAVGQKVRYRYEDKEAVIVAIRVWHDLGTFVGPPHRAIPVFDLQGDGWGVMNIKLEDLELWKPLPELPQAPRSRNL